VFSTVEDDGYAVTGVVVPRTIRGIFRKIRNNNGDALADLQGGSYDGISFQQTMDGMWPTGSNAASLIAGDFTKGIIGLRKDMTYEIFREGVITDNTGAIIFNLMQQDMVAMRVTFRVAFQTVNPVNYAQLTAANRYPFGVLRQPA
jgi:HK97 family phage major capsid protein